MKCPWKTLYAGDSRGKSAKNVWVCVFPSHWQSFLNTKDALCSLVQYCTAKLEINVWGFWERENEKVLGREYRDYIMLKLKDRKCKSLWASDFWTCPNPACTHAAQTRPDWTAEFGAQPKIQNGFHSWIWQQSKQLKSRTELCTGVIAMLFKSSSCGGR